MIDNNMDQRKNILRRALEQKKISDINGKELIQRCSKKEADSIILKTYDDMLFEYNQVLRSAIALEKCCKDLIAEKNMDEDEFMAMYIEHLFEDVIEEPELHEDKKDSSKPTFTVINGGLSEAI